MIRRAEARLKQAFHRIMLLSTVALEGCSEDHARSNELDAAVDALGPCSPREIDAAIDGGDPCAIFVGFACGLPTGVTARDGCFLSVNDCVSICSGLTGSCHADPGSCPDGSPLETGPVTIDCVVCPASGGRRTEGLTIATSESCPNALGAYFSGVSQLEAASVVAFRRLERELVHLAAPRSLVRSAARARRDEIRHARVTRRLAQRFGGHPRSPRVTKVPPRSLEAVAFENAVEGCVRETFAALVALWQATHAADESIAREMTCIAEDETRHAALAWAIHGWLVERLSLANRDRLNAGAARAITALENEIAEPAPDLVKLAGLPNAPRQRVMLRELRRALWAQSAPT